MWLICSLSVVLALTLAVGAAQAAQPSEGRDTLVAQAVQLGSAPATPGARPIFSDDFSGPELSSDWEVVNRDPDSYLVENHYLLILANSVGGLEKEKSKNIFRLRKSLPDTDWVITAKLNAKVQTAREVFSLGLYDDAKNSLTASLYSSRDCCSTRLRLQISKVSAGQTVEMHVDVMERATTQPFD